MKLAIGLTSIILVTLMVFVVFFIIPVIGGTLAVLVFGAGYFWAGFLFTFVLTFVIKMITG